jgi:hypothetical protein
MEAGVDWLIIDPGGEIGIIRGGPDYRKFGDPFTFSCVVLRRKDSTHALIMGLSGSLDRNPKLAYRAIKAALNAHGILTVDWERKKLGRVKQVRGS